MSSLVRILRSILLYEEKIDKLGQEVEKVADEVGEELCDMRAENRDMRDRLSRLEGGFAMLDRLGHLRDR